MIICMRLTGFTLFVSIYAVISSIFMQGVWIVWKAQFGTKTVTLLLALLCLAAISAILWQKIKSGLSIKRLVLISALCAWGFIFAWQQPYLSEKAHVLEFGLVGWLAMRDLSKRNKERLSKDVLYAFIFTAIIAYLGEGIQKFIPWRVFEVRDVITNVLSGILGVILFIISGGKKQLT